MEIEGLENAIMIEIYHRYNSTHRVLVVDTVENANKYISKVRKQDPNEALVFCVHECLCTKDRIIHKISDNIVVKGL